MKQDPSHSFNNIFLTSEYVFGNSLREIFDLTLLVHTSLCRSLTSIRRVLLEHFIASPFTQSIDTYRSKSSILTPGTQGYIANRHLLHH